MCIIGETSATFCKNYFYYRDKSKFAPKWFCKDLETCLIDLSKKQPHLNDLKFHLAFDDFVKIISDTLNQHAPLKLLLRKKCKMANKPWITEGIYKSIQRKRFMFKTHFMNGGTNEKKFIEIILIN